MNRNVAAKVGHNIDLRWCFEYNDGTAPKRGQWTTAASIKSDMACFQKNTNIARAKIEYRNRTTYIEGCAAHCKGEDFCLFQWEGLASLRNLMAVAKAPVRLTTGIAGLSIVMRDHIATVLVNSPKVYLRDRTPEEKSIKYETYG